MEKLAVYFNLVLKFWNSYVVTYFYISLVDVAIVI